MDGIRAYIFSVTAAAVLCAIVRTLTAGKGVGWAVELVTGLMLTLAVIGPVTNLELPKWDELTTEFLAEGSAAAAYGADLADTAQSSIIKQQMEAYILEKAEELNLPITVEVSLDAQGLPVGVICSGVAPSGSKAALSRIIAEDLGIPEEAQKWTGNE